MGILINRGLGWEEFNPRWHAIPRLVMTGQSPCDSSRRVRVMKEVVVATEEEPLESQVVSGLLTNSQTSRHSPTSGRGGLLSRRRSSNEEGHSNWFLQHLHDTKVSWM